MNKLNETYLWDRLCKVTARKAIEEMIEMGMIKDSKEAFVTLKKWIKKGLYECGSILDLGWRKEKLVLLRPENNGVALPIKQANSLYSFGGTNVWVQSDKIKNIEVMYWDEINSIEFVPVLLITLKDNTQICIDYNTIEEAENALKEYKKANIKIVK